MQLKVYYNMKKDYRVNTFDSFSFSKDIYINPATVIFVSLRNNYYKN